MYFRSATLALLLTFELFGTAGATEANWSGFYVGANAGVSWLSQRSAISLSDLDPGPWFSYPGSLPPWSGSGNGAFVASPEVGIFVGAQTNVSDRIVIGPEFEWTGGRRSSPVNLNGAFQGYVSDASFLTVSYNSSDLATAAVTLNWSAALKARLGFLASDDVLLFVSAGPSVARLTINATHVETGSTSIYYGEAIPPQPHLITTPFATSNSGSSTQTAWGMELGAGVEYRISESIRFRGEISYAKYQSVSLTVPSAGTQLGPDRFSASLKTAAVKLGVIYGF